ncbi:hypothetical protein GCM10009840_18210 [Pseudolysinimonas kribbensis]|uniref:AAA family ATPase n=1 Tax=Pseudolysinimonas kribbensis TaxID=433641 RepID=A0ABQ6K215_9MICO|nr:AAA family ATPase [Pseudolysinimonas kribbensis]GMA93796.1 hypothetical protein GCM10025881_06200 [Pseudolysinimonas kribbensis]
MNTPTTFNAQWLMNQEFDPLKYVVPGLIPEGLSILASTPKIGKSWMVLGLALGISTGAEAFGTIPLGPRRPVRYFALEDGARRLQSRLRSLGASDLSHMLEFTTQIPQGEVIKSIRDYVTNYAGLDPVVILDTLGRVMPPAGNSNAYSHDYATLSALKSIVDEVPGSSLLIVHHTRKSGGEDFLDAVSGTQGIAGAADTVLVLKRNRHDQTATLQVTSRDAAEGEYALSLDERGRWTLDGASLEESADAARLQRVTAGVSDRMADVISAIERFPEGIRPRELATITGMGNDELGKYLRRADDSGRVTKLSRGLYAPVRSVRVSETDIPFGHSDDSDTRLEVVA